MKELELKYGCNPNQKPAKIFMNDNKELPVTVLSGRPGYINFFCLLYTSPKRSQRIHGTGRSRQTGKAYA